MVVGASLAAAVLFGTASAVVVILRPHGALFGAGLSIAVGLGYALIGLWLCLALRRTGALGDGGSGPGGDGWRRPAPDPGDPQPSPGGLGLWPEFERDLRAYLDAQEREPVTR